LKDVSGACWPCDTSLFLVGRRARNTKRSRSRARERLARDLDAFGGKFELAYENAGHTAPGTRENRHVPRRHRVEIDGQQYDRLACRSRDLLTQDDALIGGFIVAFLLAALMWFLWIAPGLAMYFASGLIRLPPLF
jgi:hypothetical protein